VVTYSGSNPIDVSTIQPGGLAVSGPPGDLTVLSVTTAPASNAQSIVATYTVRAPGGAWSSADDGTYTLSTVGGAVSDVAGDPTGAVSGSFQVAIPSGPAVSPIDTTFNAGGPVVTGFITEAAARDGSGRTLVAGYQGSPSAGTGQSVLQRINPDGSLDTFFGAGGQVISTIGGDAFFAVTTDSAGRIIAAGQRGSDLLLERFTSKGVLDRRFGTRGVVVASLGGSGAVAYSLVIAPNGDIVAGGTSGGQAVILRFLTSGKLDRGFASAGSLSTSAPAGTQIAITGLAVEADGTIVAAGDATDSSGVTAVFVLRATASGALDPTFGTNGQAAVAALDPVSPAGGLDRNIGFALQPDGKVLVASRTAGGHFGTIRLNTDGSVDTTFGVGGLATTNFGGVDEANTIRVEATGQIYVAGISQAGGAGGSPELAVAAYNPDGSPLASFNGTGMLTVAPDITSAAGSSTPLDPSVMHAYGALQNDGQLLVGATDETTVLPTAASLRRLNVTGSADVGTFGQVAGLRGSQKLSFVAADGAVMTASLTGPGTGSVLYDGTSVGLVLAGTSSKSSLSFKANAGPVVLANIQVNGPLGAFTARAELTGTFFINGPAGKLTLGSVNGGTIAAAGTIASLTIGGPVSNANVLSGVNLGSDDLLGGAGAAADTFAAGAILKLKVSGAVTGSLFAAGLRPVDGVVALAAPPSDDQVIGGAASKIPSISLGGIDSVTRFIAGAFGTAKVPKSVNPPADPNFEVL
jgi:uncharacterized delta-60 repeat protein